MRCEGEVLRNCWTDATAVARFDLFGHCVKRSATITMNMAVSESHIDPLAVYAGHSFADDQAYQVSPTVARRIFHS